MKPKLFSQHTKVIKIAVTQVENSTMYTQHILGFDSYFVRCKNE